MMAMSPKRYYYEYMAKRISPLANAHTSIGEHVDHVLELDNLKDFQDASVAAIYAEAQTLEEAPPSLLSSKSGGASCNRAAPSS